jgi:hypothetical protein
MYLNFTKKRAENVSMAIFMYPRGFGFVGLLKMNLSWENKTLFGGFWCK